jgi:hypothetical protein
MAMKKKMMLQANRVSLLDELGVRSLVIETI